MHAVQAGGRAISSPNSNCLYTPTFDASDKEEEEVESSDPDLSDYYSDSGYPTLPRPRLVLWSSRRNYSPPPSPSDDRQRKAGTPPPAIGQKLADSTRVRSRHRRLPAGLPTTPRETCSSKGKAFSKLRSLRNNRILPASSPENERPPSTLVTTCISAHGKGATQTAANSAGHPKQLRSVSLPTGDSTMAQAKQKKSKKPNRALSFSFGSGDKKKRARSLFGSIGRGKGETFGEMTAAPHSPVLMGRRLGAGTKTIYEEDRSSLSSVEEEEERMNSLNYLHGNRFGSCRELTSLGLSATTESGSVDQPQLRPLSKRRHKRPSLPNFAKHFPHSASGRASPQEEEGDRTQADGSSVSSQVSEITPPNSATSSPTPSRGRVRIRKLSDPGSAPSTPETGNSPLAERRVAREDGGVARGSRPLRKGFTFSVGGGNLSPAWVRSVCVCVCVCVCSGVLSRIVSGSTPSLRGARIAVAMLSPSLHGSSKGSVVSTVCRHQCTQPMSDPTGSGSVVKHATHVAHTTSHLLCSMVEGGREEGERERGERGRERGERGREGERRGEEGEGERAGEKVSLTPGLLFDLRVPSSAAQLLLGHCLGLGHEIHCMLPNTSPSQPLQKEMRHHVVRFLLETEQSYVQSLRTIIKVRVCASLLSPLLSLLHTHTCTHARTHARTHTHMYIIINVLHTQYPSCVMCSCWLCCAGVPSDKGFPGHSVMGCGFLPMSSHVLISVSLTSRRE